MNLLPSAEQQELVAAATALLAKELPIGRLPDRTLWARLGALGWFGLALPERAGGTGYGVAEEVLLFREIGRALAPGPFLAQVLGAHVAHSTGERALLREIAGGNVAVALAEPHRDPGACAGRFTSGRFRVLDAGGAELLLVVAQGGAVLVSAGLARAPEAHPSLDRATGVSLATLESAPALAFAPEGSGPRRDVVARGRVLVAGVLAGICEATRDESAAYARQRVQFGRPIGAFQAVKHRCADMAVRAEAAASLTFLAALSLTAGAPDASRLVLLAKALATEHALANAADDIQNHGGTGFTAACPAHLYLARANLLSTVLGTPAQHYLEGLRRD